MQKILKSPLKKKLYTLMGIMENNPYAPPCEKLTGELTGLYSRRLNIQHRIVYQIYEEEKSIKIIRMWSHYGDN